MMTQQAPVLRPLGAGDLIDETIDLYRSNFLTFFGIAAVLMVPAMLLVYVVSAAVGPALAAAASRLAGGLPGETAALEEASTTLSSTLLILLVGGPAALVSSAALTQAVSDAYIGQAAGIVASYERIMRRLGPLIGTVLVSYIPLVVVSVILVAAVLSLGVAVAALGESLGPAALLPALVIVLLLLIAYVAAVVAIVVWIALVPPAFIVEDTRYLGALRRAWTLAKSRFWAILGVVVLTQILASVVAGPFQFLAYALQERGTALGTIGGAIYGLSIALTTPATLVPTVLLYFDSRVRLEGYDVELLAREIGQDTPGPSEAV